MERENLIDKARSFFKMSLETPGGRKTADFIRWHQIIRFIVDNKPVFYLDVKRGEVHVYPGEGPKQDIETEFHNASRAYTDTETLNKIFEGKKDSSEAQWEDETFILLPTGNYAQITFLHQLFRFGREKILEERRREFEESE